MSADRKSKLRKKEEKSAKAWAKKLAVLDRMLRFLGIKEIFDRLPVEVKEFFVESIEPATEVIVAEDSREDPEIKEAARNIEGFLRKPLRTTFEGREIELTADDSCRAYIPVTRDINGYLREFGRDTRPWVRDVCALLREAKNVLDALDEHWRHGVVAMVVGQIRDVTDRNFRVDGRMIEVNLKYIRNPEGRNYSQMELRLRTAKPHVVSYQGSQWTTFPCMCSCTPFGLDHVSWDCQQLGIEGPSRRLPVYIEKHAIKRLLERLPVRGHESCLHRLMVGALERPVVIPQDEQKCLVELRLGGHRVGYFVAQVLPQMVLVKTYIFLTMQGTPEAAMLRKKLGLYRADIEHYRLDEFYTLVASDIVGDPLLARVLTECGCGHLISLIDPVDRLQWLGRFGDRFRETFELREARDGFVAGQTWNRWSV